MHWRWHWHHNHAVGEPQQFHYLMLVSHAPQSAWGHFCCFWNVFQRPCSLCPVAYTSRMLMLLRIFSFTLFQLSLLPWLLSSCFTRSLYGTSHMITIRSYMQIRSSSFSTWQMPQLIWISYDRTKCKKKHCAIISFSVISRDLVFNFGKLQKHDIRRFYILKNMMQSEVVLVYMGTETWGQTKKKRQDIRCVRKKKVA